jgi:hypothetical protein
MFVRSNTSTQMLAAKRTAQFHHEIPAEPYTIQHNEKITNKSVSNTETGNVTQ